MEDSTGYVCNIYYVKGNKLKTIWSYQDSAQDYVPEDASEYGEGQVPYQIVYMKKSTNESLVEESYESDVKTVTDEVYQRILLSQLLNHIIIRSQGEIRFDSLGSTFTVMIARN